MKQVIGYIDETFNNDFLSRYRVKSNELIGATVQTCFALAVDSKTVGKPHEAKNVVDKMVSENIDTLTKFYEVNLIAEIMFQNPMPEYVFNKYYRDKKAIYE